MFGISLTSCTALHLLKICNKKITKHHSINLCLLISSTDHVKT
nr:MAG TPA: hypothetical protein [Caudoviricetes sp.]